MEQKRENIEQIDKKKIDSNLIVDNQKSSERNISTGLIDDDPKPKKIIIVKIIIMIMLFKIFLDK